MHYQIGAFVLRPEANTLIGPTGSETLEPRTIELLAYLAEHAGEVISVDDLLRDLWTGRVVTDSSVYRQVAELRRFLGDDARRPAYIETVRKRGYRLISEVTILPAAGAEIGQQEMAPAASNIPDRKSPVAWLGLGAALVLIVAVFASLALWQREQPTSAVDVPGPVTAGVSLLAVMPFDRLSPGLPAYLSDSLARVVNDRLAEVQSLRVTAYAGVRQLAAEGDLRAVVAALHVATVVTGSLQAVGDNQLQLSLAIVDTRTMEQTWTRSFLVPESALAELHDQAAVAVARALDAEVALTPAAATVPLVAFEANQRGALALDSGYSQPTLERAVDAFDAALAAAPDYAEALAGRAVAHLRLYTNYHDHSDTRLALAQADVDAAMALDADGTAALFAAGMLEALTGSRAEALAFLERAVRQRPSWAAAQSALGRTATRVGNLPLGLKHLRQAALLDPLRAGIKYELGLTEFYAGEFSAAEKSLRAALTVSPELIEANLYLSALYIAWLADTRAASVELRRVREKIGTEAFMQMLLLPGTWAFFSWAEPDLIEILESWSVAEQGGDVGAWHLAMGEQTARRNDTVSAARHYAAAVAARTDDVALNPSDPWYAAELAVAFAGLGDAQAARVQAERMLLLAPVAEDAWSNSDFLWLNATILAMLGDSEGAIAQVRDASTYPSILTPNSLRVDPLWSDYFERPEFIALVSADGNRWQAASAPSSP
ncbi:MAG: winged helix-turn-helix domain-containing protein [Pseudomonadota bacterium]